MKPTTLSPKMSEALCALARYHYLMPYQFSRLNGFGKERAVDKLLRRFGSAKSEIGCIRSGVEPGRGRVPRLYYLTKAGAEHVAERWQCDRESVFYPKGDTLPLLDVRHRALTVDCWIELDRHAAATGATIEFFHPYFRTTGANRNADAATRLKKLTRIDFPPDLAKRHAKPFFWPDAAFVLRTGSKRVLCLLEAYRGIDTGRVLRQLEWHLLALEHGLPSLRYGLETGNLILLVFETEAAMAAVLQRLLVRPGFEEFAAFVASSTIGRLRENFLDWWYVCGGEIRPGALW